MPRLLFEKKGNAVWISHLDLMRMFQRAFKRAGLHLTHTHGFNPRPSVSIALPLSVGVESSCEILDFDLEEEGTACEEIRDRLNKTLISGIRVLDVYNSGRKLKELELLDCTVTLEYDSGVPAGAENQIKELFSRNSVIVAKKNKNGIQDQDLIPMIRRLTAARESDRILKLNALVCCQNPTLNPMQLSAAIVKYLPEAAPDFTKCCRNEIYDRQENVYR